MNTSMQSSPLQQLDMKDWNHNHIMTRLKSILTPLVARLIHLVLGRG